MIKKTKKFKGMNDNENNIEENLEEDKENSETIDMEILLKYFTQVHSNENYFQGQKG